jgi:hypothetical protein
MKTNKSVKGCRQNEHQWEPILTPGNYLQMMRCTRCPAVLGPQERCAECPHDLEDHEFDGTLECLIVSPDPTKDSRCLCKAFVTRGLAVG